MKRKTLVNCSFAFLTAYGCLNPPFLSPANAADARPETTVSETTGKQSGDAAKDDTDTKSEAADAKAKAEVRLLKLFKAHEPITNTLDMVMVWLPKEYRVAQHEVTQREFEAVMKSNPSKFKGGLYPVDSVTLNDAQEFCRKLTKAEQSAGKLPKSFSYTLPTEGQWDYYVDEAALKDGITSFLGDRKNPENVGQLRPNEFGLYDVRGNVWEWCSDATARGGSWRSYEDYCEISFRYTATPTTALDDIGFRVILMEH